MQVHLASLACPQKRELGVMGQNGRRVMGLFTAIYQSRGMDGVVKFPAG